MTMANSSRQSVSIRDEAGVECTRNSQNTLHARGGLFSFFTRTSCSLQALFTNAHHTNAERRALRQRLSKEKQHNAHAGFRPHVTVTRTDVTNGANRSYRYPAVGFELEKIQNMP